MSVIKYLKLAADVSRLKDDGRRYFHGAVAMREDGVLVASSNGNPKEPEVKHHAEYRCLRKAGKGSVLYIARTLDNGDWADTTPCSHCESFIRRKKVRLVFYTVGPDDYRLWVPGRSERLKRRLG